MDKKYNIVTLIGEGSFGSVYLVKDGKNRSYALKKINVDPFQIDQALKQIEVMKKFVHSNLIRIYDSSFDQNNSCLEIVMEYCEEGDLFNYYKEKKKSMSPSEILNIFKQIVQAFILMNVKGVIHRDLKPQNILMGKGSVIKIADFGCARTVNTQHISQVDNFSLDKGTPIYASPEQLMNQKYSAKCDVWSAGCLLYFIYFGQHPFMDTRVHNTLALIKKKTQNKEIELDKTTDPAIAQILSLTLIYQDKQRSSWRELYLSRIFADKIQNVKSFVEYLKFISVIANWIAKDFWKFRKTANIGKQKDQIFVYFIIKFQYTCMKMALEILNRDKKHRYLFDQKAYKKFQPSEDLVDQIKKQLVQQEKYYLTIKKSMKSKDVYKLIEERQANRISLFADLDNSIRATYKIILDIKQNTNKIDSKDNKIWICMCRWLNFEKWFSFEKQPRVQKILAQSYSEKQMQNILKEELDKYQNGIVE